MRRPIWIILTLAGIVATGLMAFAIVLVSISDQSGQTMEVRPAPGGPYLSLEPDDVQAHVPFLITYLALADNEGRAVFLDGHAVQLEDFLRSKHGPNSDWRWFDYRGQSYMILVTVL